MKIVNPVIGIHAVPRSGTSWLAQLFNAHPDVAVKFQPLFSYAFKNYLSLSSTAQDIDTFLDKIYRSDDYFINMKDPEIHKNYPVFQKNNQPKHLCFKHVRYHYLIEHFLQNHSSIKFILLIRNPLSVLASWYRAPREFNPSWDFQKEWRQARLKNQERKEEYFGFEKWKEAAELFLALQQKYPDRVVVLKYIELLNHTEQTIRELFRFAGITYHSQVNSFIQASKSRSDNDPNSVYKQKDKKDNDWETVLPKNIIFEVIQELKGTVLEQFL